MFKPKMPAKPKDGFRLDWWIIVSYGGDVPRVEKRSAVYHLKKTWAQVCPGDAKAGGANFDDQWQIFSNDHFDGRCEGWDAHKRWLTDEPHDRYGSERDAIKDVIKVMKARAERMQEQARHMLDEMKVMTIRLAELSDAEA